MFASDNIFGTATALGPEKSGLTSQTQINLWPAGQHQFRAQVPVPRYPNPAALSEVPGEGPAMERPAKTLRDMHFPQWVRRIIPSREEARDPRLGALTGQPADIQRDPIGSASLVQPAHSFKVGDREVGDVLDTHRVIPDPVSFLGEALGDVSPDVTMQRQDAWTNAHAALHTARASFPGIKVAPIPQTRGAVLTSFNISVDVPLPSGAVLCRVVWSNAQQNDLYMSFNGGATLKPGFISTNSGDPTFYDGLILNPDPGSYYYVKNKLAISFAAVGLSYDPNAYEPVFVNLQCYVQA